jgi:translation initiation factor IF-1
MSNEDVIQMQGEIVDNPPDATFRVKVMVEMTPYDLVRGRIASKVK